MRLTRPQARLLAALVCGLAGGHFAYLNATHLARPRDVGQVWFAARALLHGHDPYALVGPGLAFDWPAPLLYPLPAAFALIPLAPLPVSVAAALFIGLGVACLAWALTREAWGPLLGIVSTSVLYACEVAQWSPLLAASFALPVLGILLVAKPTIGAALFVAKPSWWTVGGGLALLLLACAVQPHWLLHYRDAIMRNAAIDPPTAPYGAPVTLPGGFLALLALLRWRRPEARLIAAMACVPQTFILYETVPLLLVLRTRGEALVFVLLSWAAWWVIRVTPPPRLYTDLMHQIGLVMVWGFYLPCTLMVLRRPNEGTVPAAVASLRGRVREAA